MNIQSISWQGIMLGRYRLTTLLGRGGMGEVWLADDIQLRRRVAVKILPSVLASDHGYRQDFAYEARTAASLDHPHILAVHDFGEQSLQGEEIVMYLIMPYVSGGSLRDSIRQRQGPLSAHEGLHYLSQAAQAIDYAHSKGVLHRDIKPANMLLENGWLFLADFGIAKLLSSATTRGKTYAGSGTPDYMAPEQIQGHAQPASDRYSLAMVAYQLYTGHLPFAGDTAYDTLIKQLQEPPPAPRLFNAAIPGAVEAVLLQGLAKRPEERPTSCAAFVAALDQAWKQGGRGMQGDPDATVLAPWGKRAASMEPTQVPFPLASITPTQGSSARINAEPGRGVAPAAMASTVYQQPYPFHTTSGTSYPAPLAPAPPQQTYVSPPVPGISQSPPGTFSTQRPRSHLPRRELLIGGAAAAGLIVAGAAGRSVLLNSRSGTHSRQMRPKPGPQKLIPGVPLLSLTGHNDQVWTAVWHPSGRYLATAGNDTRVMLWDIAGALNGQTAGLHILSTPTRTWKFSGQIRNNQLSWSRDGSTLAVVTSAADSIGKIYLIDAFAPGSTPQVFVDKSQLLLAPTYSYIAWSPTANTFATSIFQSGDVDLWQPDHHSDPVKILHYARKNPIVDIEEIGWSSDGSLLAGSSNDFHISIWQAQTGVSIATLEKPSRFDQPVVFSLRSTLAWSPADTHILLTDDLDTAAVWDTRKKAPLLLLGTDDPIALTPPKQKSSEIPWTPNVTGLTWSPDGRYIIGGYGRSHRLYVWDVQQPGPLKKGIHPQSFYFGDTMGHSDTIIDVAWSPNGRYVASTSYDQTVIVWKVDAG